MARKFYILDLLPVVFALLLAVMVSLESEYVYENIGICIFMSGILAPFFLLLIGYKYFTFDKRACALRIILTFVSVILMLAVEFASYIIKYNLFAENYRNILAECLPCLIAAYYSAAILVFGWLGIVLLKNMPGEFNKHLYIPWCVIPCALTFIMPFFIHSGGAAQIAFFVYSAVAVPVFITIFHISFYVKSLKYNILSLLLILVNSLAGLVFTALDSIIIQNCFPPYFPAAAAVSFIMPLVLWPVVCVYKTLK